MTLSRIKYLVPFTVLFLLLGMLWNELSSNRSFAYSSGITGERMPTFSVPSLFGNDRLSNKSFGGRVVLLNFWASWCSACQAEHAMLMKIKNDYHVPIYGVAFKDDPNESREMLRNEGNPYTMVGYDDKGVTGVDFGIYATPETFVVSPSGNIVYRQIGVIDQETWDNTIYPIIKNYEKS